MNGERAESLFEKPDPRRASPSLRAPREMLEGGKMGSEK